MLLGTVPQGQGHATVAREVVADRLGLPVEQVRPVVEMDTATTPWTVSSGSYSSRFAPLLTSARRRGGRPDRGDTSAPRRRCCWSVDPDAPRARRRAGPGARRARAAVPFRHAAGLVHWDPGALPDGVSARLYEEAAFTPPQVRRPPRRTTRSTPASATGSWRTSSPCGSTRRRSSSDRRVSSVHDAGTMLEPDAARGPGARRDRAGARRRDVRGDAPTATPASRPRATFMDYLCPTTAEATLPADTATTWRPRRR